MTKVFNFVRSFQTFYKHASNDTELHCSNVLAMPPSMYIWKLIMSLYFVQENDFMISTSDYCIFIQYNDKHDGILNSQSITSYYTQSVPIRTMFSYLNLSLLAFLTYTAIHCVFCIMNHCVVIVWGVLL